MADATFTIGSPATCTDGHCGKVIKVVVDPVARELTHLVVEPEHRSRTRPPGAARPGQFGRGRRRSCATPSTSSTPCRNAEENDFLPGGSGYEDYAAHEAYYWPYFGIEGGPDPLVANASAIVTHDTSPPAKSACAAATPCTPPTGRSARWKGWSSTRPAGHVTHVLLQEGHLWGRKDVAIPIGAVDPHGRRRNHGLADQARDRRPACRRPRPSRAVTPRSPPRSPGSGSRGRGGWRSGSVGEVAHGAHG